MVGGFRLAEIPGPEVDIGEGCSFDATVRWGHRVRLGAGVHVGAGTVLYDGVEIGADSWIGPGCSLGEPTMGLYRDAEAHEWAATRIGERSIVRRGTVVNAGSQAGRGLQTGPHVAIREGVRIGDHCSIGNAADIQYDVEIGDYTRLHSFVAIGSGSRIGPFVWIHPFVVLTNDRLFPTFAAPEAPVVAPFCAIAVHSTLLPGARLGVHTIVGAHSKVGGDVPAWAFMDGAPAENRIDCRRILHKVGDRVHRPYPWIRRVSRDYPWADVPPEKRRVEDWVPEPWSEYL